MENEKRYCKGCHADVTEHMMCICGEFPLSKEATYSQEELDSLDLKVNKARVEKFYKKISDWLIPKGFQEVFKNHPCQIPRVWHFSKNSIRVVITEDGEFRFHKDIHHQNGNYALISGKYPVGYLKFEKVFHDFTYLVNCVQKT